MKIKNLFHASTQFRYATEVLVYKGNSKKLLYNGLYEAMPTEYKNIEVRFFTLCDYGDTKSIVIEV